MATRIMLAALLCIACWLPSSAQPQYAGFTPMQGQVMARGAPVPGVMVSLIHRMNGRSIPVYTDMYGRFGWPAIPINPEPYFIEVYWGNTLVYRGAVHVSNYAPVYVPIML